MHRQLRCPSIKAVGSLSVLTASLWCWMTPAAM
jgi:hypothetical protein